MKPQVGDELHMVAKKLSPLEAEHTPEAIAKRIALDRPPGYLRDFVYGSIDGLVTTFAIVSGVIGADLSTRVIVILGFTNLLADGFSMAVSNFLGTKADREVVDRARNIEESHINKIPLGEAQEVREIFRRKGFDGDLLEQVVGVVTADRKLWIDTMLREEWGLSLRGPIPLRAAATTFAAFVTMGLLPLLPFVIAYSRPGAELMRFTFSSGATAITFFSIGAMKSRFGTGTWFRSGLETLAMGGAAAALAFAVGVFLKQFGL